MRPITPPKFIWDPIAHDDIDGSWPKKQAYYQTWDIMKVDDIHGSKPRSLTGTWATWFNNIDYRDVTHAHFKTKRHCDPLNPSYKVRDEDGQVIDIGQIDGNAPAAIPKRETGPISLSLKTDDIVGAQSSSKGMGVFAHREWKHFRKTNTCHDIEGTTASSLQKAPKTKRVSNPLEPNYVAPGDVEYKGADRHMMDWLGEAYPPKKERVARKPPTFPDMKPEKTFQGQITDKDQLNKNRNQFYGQEGAGPNIDVNKLYQAKAAHQGSAPGVPEEIQN